MNIEEIRQFAFSYLDGCSDTKKERKLLDFLEENDTNRKLFSTWEKEWKSQKTSKADISLLVNIEDKINSRRKKSMIATVSVVAALVVFLIGVFSIAVFDYDFQKISNTHTTVIETGPCDRTRIALPDGTSVMLNSCSKLSYGADFNRSERKVELSGEAYFEVVADSKSRFIVDFGQERIIVKGTKFNVVAYDRINTMSIALMEGKVEFNEGENLISINPGEVMHYDKVTRNLTKHPDDVTKYNSWQAGRIEYSNVTLNVLFERLACIYDLDIRYVPGKYSDREFSISLTTQENITDILDAISVIMPIKWSKKDKLIIVNEL